MLPMRLLVFANHKIQAWSKLSKIGSLFSHSFSSSEAQSPTRVISFLLYLPYLQSSFIHFWEVFFHIILFSWIRLVFREPERGNSVHNLSKFATWISSCMHIWSFSKITFHLLRNTPEGTSLHNLSSGEPVLYN